MRLVPLDDDPGKWQRYFADMAAGKKVTDPLLYIPNQVGNGKASSEMTGPLMYATNHDPSSGTIMTPVKSALKHIRETIGKNSSVPADMGGASRGRKRKADMSPANPSSIKRRAVKKVSHSRNRARKKSTSKRRKKKKSKSRRRRKKTVKTKKKRKRKRAKKKKGGKRRRKRKQSKKRRKKRGSRKKATRKKKKRGRQVAAKKKRTSGNYKDIFTRYTAKRRKGRRKKKK